MTERVPDWLAHRAAVRPEHLAIVTTDATVTYRDLDERVSRLAAGLRARGVVPGDRVALLAQNSLAFVEAVHAVARAGGVLVPLNARLTAGELAWQIGRVRPRLFLTTPALFDLAAAATASGGPPPLLCDEVDAAEGLAPPEDGYDRDTVHSIIFTSGTTGRPKGAMLTFGNFWASAVASAFNLGVLPGDRWLACLPLFHVGGLSIVLRSAIYGTTVLLHGGFDEVAANAALREGGATVVSLVATMLRRMLDADDRPYPPSLRCALIGGGPVPRDLLERAATRGMPVVQTYGLTEAASQVATLSPLDAEEHLGSAGNPLLGTSLRIDGPPGGPGEILVRGPTVTPGYFEDPEATAARLRDGWLHTGDVGRLDAAGFLTVLDRDDGLIITGGENVYAAEVEAALLAHPAVAAAAVVGVRDERWGQAVAAAIVVSDEVEDGVLDTWLRERLAAYKRPRLLRRVASLPTTASGKVQRYLVREAFDTSH